MTVLKTRREVFANISILQTFEPGINVVALILTCISQSRDAASKKYN